MIGCAAFNVLVRPLASVVRRRLLLLAVDILRSIKTLILVRIRIGIFTENGAVADYRVFNFGKSTKSGIPAWFLNKIGYLFFRDGARLRNLPVVCGIFRVRLR